MCVENLNQIVHLVGVKSGWGFVDHQTEGFKYLQKDLDFVSHGPLETTEEGNKISLCSNDHLVTAVSDNMNLCI